MVTAKCDKCGKEVKYTALHKTEETGYCDLCGSCYDEYYKGREEVLERYRKEYFSFLNKETSASKEGNYSCSDEKSTLGNVINGVYYPANCQPTELCFYCNHRHNCSLNKKGVIKS